MGKAIVGILEIAAGVALTAFSAGALAPVGLALVGAGLTTLLAPPPPKPGRNEAVLKSPTPPRLSGYGTIRTHGAYALYETSDSKDAVDVMMFHDGQIDGVVQLYVGDKRITTAGGYVDTADDGAFGTEVVRVGTNLGLPTEAAFSEVISAVPDHWTADHRGDGIMSGWMISPNVKAKNFQRVYPTGGPNQSPLNVAIRAQLVFDWRGETQSIDDPTTWKWSENVTLAIAHYLMVRMGKDWSLHFAPALDYWTAAADVDDEAVQLKGVQTILTSKVSDGATSITVASVNGLAIGMSISIFVSGDTTKTEAKTVTGISGNTISFSGGLGHKHPSGSQVSWASSPTAPATEKRYRTCVAHEHTEAHKDVLGKLLLCNDGWLAPRSDGALVIYSGRYVAPTIDPLGPDEIASYSYQEGVNEEDAVNSLKVSYVSANHDYNTVQTDDWTDEGDISGRGKLLADSLEAQSPSFSQNRRLAKRKLAKIMAPSRGTITTLASGRRILGRRYVPLLIQEAGATFFEGVVEVQKLTRNLATGGVTFDWIAADPNIDDWNPATEEGEPAPVGNRVAVADLATPEITAAAVNFGADSGSGTTGAFLELTASGPDRDDLTWYARTRLVGAAIWGEREYSDLDAGTSVEIATEFVPTDAMVEAQVAYSTGDGRVSDWSDSVTVDTSTADVAPPPVTGLAATGGTGSANLGWRNPTSRLDHVALYRGTTTSFGSATLVTTLAGGLGQVMSYTDGGLSPGAYYWWVKAVSAGGAMSAAVGPASATVT